MVFKSSADLIKYTETNDDIQVSEGNICWFKTPQEWRYVICLYLFWMETHSFNTQSVKDNTGIYLKCVERQPRPRETLLRNANKENQIPPCVISW